MKIFKVNRNIEIVCVSKSHSRGFYHRATLMYKNRECESVKVSYINRTWERYTFESVLHKLAEKTKTLSKSQKKTLQDYIKNEGRVEDDLKPLKSIAMVAKLGDIFAGDSQKAKNDWKARMLKAGLENKGLIMPEDWEELSESEKERRLDGAIKVLGE